MDAARLLHIGGTLLDPWQGDILADWMGRDAAGEPVCTARMFEERPGVWHIGRVATYAARRGRGYAGAMMREMCREAAARGGKTASLGAQVERQSFYEALGFSPVGEVFLDCGQPHIEMHRAL